MSFKVFRQALLISCLVLVISATGIENIRDILGIGKGIIPSIPENLKEILGTGKYPTGHKPQCPLCDSSVYSYCSDKLFHDSCCCSSPYDHLPRQCEYADCSFLHSNSCYEHRLITQCCCSNHIFYKK